MEDRRTFLLRLTPRVMGISAAYSLALGPVWAHSEGESFASYLKTDKYKRLLAELSVKHRFDKAQLTQVFGKARFLSEVPRHFEKPAEAMPYARYQRIFLGAKMEQMGDEYVKQHRALFEEVEADYGVDQMVIAAILGVETRFGRRTHGGYRVFDALNTMYAAIPSRAKFARKELIQFMLLCREEGFDPLKLQGSYAGAMGIPQFISSSYRAYAVDYDGNGQRDLWKSPQDILGSVANYFKVHGWKRGRPSRLPVRVDEERPEIQKLLERGMKAKTSVSSLEKMGMLWEENPPAGGKKEEVSLLSYDDKGKKKVVAVFSNFRTILRYNHAVNYGLVVADLAEAFSKKIT